MAVYTPLDETDCRALLDHYDAGTYLRHVGIGAGIENTNYFLDTHRARYVLTVFERLTAAQVPYYLELSAHFAARALPVPEPLRVATGPTAGQLYVTCKGKPAALVRRVPGQDLLWPQPPHCAQIGAALAQMHLAAGTYPLRQPNLRGLPWVQTMVPVLRPHVPAMLFALLAEEAAVQALYSAGPEYAGLPRGAVHADLFRDNALFEADRLTGIIDFYFAGDDTFAFDLCVTLNDWCIDQASGALDMPRARAMLAAYQQHRPLDSGERHALPLMARAAALRFWVSRLADWYMPRDAALLTPKDPTHFERILQLRRDAPLNFSELADHT
jgi:homoserine kinase type II